jgi:hypothetical protein
MLARIRNMRHFGFPSQSKSPCRILLLILLPMLHGQEFPGREWQRIQNPADAGFSPRALSLAMDKAKPMGAAAIAVVANGKLLATSGDPALVLPIHSVRKSILSALFGTVPRLFQPTGLDTTLEQLRIDDRTPLTPQERKATVRHLLQAKSGVYLPSNLASDSMLKNLPKRDSHAPGTFWYYNNWDFNALGTIYQQASRMDVFSGFDGTLAKPLEMEHWILKEHGRWSDDRLSIHRGYEFWLSALDLARFGWLMANNGNWRGNQIVPAAWVAESTRSQTILAKQPGGYGYMWWTETDGRMLPKTRLPSGSFSAQGMGGHMILVVPSFQLVVVIRARTDLPSWTPFVKTRLSPDAVESFLSALLAARFEAGTKR